MKRPWRDGTTDIIFDALDFLAKLAALVPAPRVDLTRLKGQGWRTRCPIDRPSAFPACGNRQGVRRSSSCRQRDASDAQLYLGATHDESFRVGRLAMRTLRPDENFGGNSSTRCDTKDSRVSRIAFSRPTTGACRLRVHRPDRTILNPGLTTPRDPCVPPTSDIASNLPRARKWSLESAVLRQISA